MFRLIRGLFWIAMGAAGALEAEKLFDKAAARFRPSAVAGGLLDRLNRRLEADSPRR